MQPDYPLILLVGAGRMGSALLRGWLASGIPSEHIIVREPAPSEDLRRLLHEHAIASEITCGPDVIVMATKPQLFRSVLPEISAFVSAKTVVLSVGAGQTVARIAEHLPLNTAIIRSIPNLPAEVGKGITACYASANTDGFQRAVCESLLRAVGEVVWIDEESLIDPITAVSGSGPAYVFYLVECLAQAGQKAGLSPEIAHQLARKTIIGAGELLHRSTLPASQLRENVTSPGGTTAAALAELMKANALPDLISDAVKAATIRSRALND